LFPDGAAASRSVTAAFRKAWGERHPDGTVIYRDLATNPVPRLTADAHTAGFVDPAAHDPDAGQAPRGIRVPSRGAHHGSAQPGDGRLVPLFEASRERAHQDAAAKAREVAERLAA
jgi:hypothetical protein